MAGKVSMEDIAQQLGISKNTVSLVFRGIPGVNEATRARVLETASMMGYVYPKERSQEEIPQQVTSICIMMPYSAKNSFAFYSHVQFGIENEARKNKLNTIISYYDDEEGLPALPLCIKDSLVSGIITIGKIKREVYALLRKSSLPIVMADHYYEDELLDCILSDNFCGGYIATKYLISKGHTNIGFLGDTNLSVSFFDRFAGYRKALQSGHLPEKDEFVINKSFEKLAPEETTQVITELSARTTLPTAFFCCNDIEAINLVKCLGSLGYNLPGDISVIGFDNIDLTRNIHPELTTINVSKEYMGIKAVQKLLNLMENRSLLPEKLILGVTLVERQSVVTCSRHQ